MLNFRSHFQRNHLGRSLTDSDTTASHQSYSEVGGGYVHFVNIPLATLPEGPSEFCEKSDGYVFSHADSQGFPFKISYLDLGYSSFLRIVRFVSCGEIIFNAFVPKQFACLVLEKREAGDGKETFKRRERAADDSGSRSDNRSLSSSRVRPSRSAEALSPEEAAALMEEVVKTPHTIAPKLASESLPAAPYSVALPRPSAAQSHKRGSRSLRIKEMTSAFIIPELPSGQHLEFNILSTWGDPHYLGLMGWFLCTLAL